MNDLGGLRLAADATIAAARMPGIVLAVARPGDTIAILAEGVDGRGAALGPESLIPVASITKLATALAIHRLHDRGALTLDDQLGRHLPAAATASATIRQLLCHTGGLPLDLPDSAAPYRPGLDWPRLGAACLTVPADRAAGERVQYSNVGYGLLALVVERLTAQRFADALAELVLAPLEITGYLGVEPPRAPSVIADVRSEQSGSALEPYNSPFWRSLALPWGGLVTTAEGALRLVLAFAGAPSGFLSQAALAESTRRQTNDLAGGMGGPLLWTPSPWALGPELRGGKTPHWAPASADPASYGHAGASGCVAWYDPAERIAWAILGTRTADSGWLLRQGAALGGEILRIASARPN